MGNGLTDYAWPHSLDSTCSKVSVALVEGSASLAMGAVSAVLSGAALLAALSKDGELRGEDWHDILPAQCRKDFTGVRSRYTLSWSPSNLLSLLGTSSCKRDHLLQPEAQETPRCRAALSQAIGSIFQKSWRNERPSLRVIPQRAFRCTEGKAPPVFLH